MSVELDTIEVIGDPKSYPSSTLVQAATTEFPIGSSFSIGSLGARTRVEIVPEVLSKMLCVEQTRQHPRKRWVRRYDPRNYPDSRYPMSCGRCVYAKGDAEAKCAILIQHHLIQGYSSR